MTIYEIERDAGKIKVRVVPKGGKVINGKFYPEGYIEVVSGVSGEIYAFPPSVGKANYKIEENPEFYRDLLKHNGGKLP